MLKSEGGGMSCDDLRRDIAIALLMAGTGICRDGVCYVIKSFSFQGECEGEGIWEPKTI